MTLYRVFRNETDKCRQRVREVILSKKNSHMNHASIRLRYRGMGQNVYSL
jgi:hypothetical protein